MTEKNEKGSLQSTLGPEHLGGGEFESEGGKVILSLTDQGLSWKSNSGKEEISNFIEWRDIIRCHKGKVSASSPLEVPDVTEKDTSFTLHYIEMGENYVWKHAYKTFDSEGRDPSDVMQIILRKSIEDHPKRLLVVINPVSGSGRSESNYTKLVAPLFKLAQIDTDVIVSQTPRHPEEIGATYDFSTVDGVVIVGGDGTYQQLIHTWLPRIQKEAGVDMTDEESEFKPSPCPVGMIPTGTGNGLAKGSYGCVDVVTAALNIISGRQIPKNLLSVTNKGKFFGFVGIVLGNGYWSDILDKDAQSRFLGWLRYPIMMLMTAFRRRREFQVRLQYKPMKNLRETKEEETKQNNESVEQDWVTVEGVYTGVNCVPGIFRRDVEGDKMKIDMDAKGVTLLLEKQCGRIQYWKWMYRLMQFYKDTFDEDFLTPVAVLSYRLQIVPRENSTEWEQRMETRVNIDGEVRAFEGGEIFVRNHPKMTMSYGTGPLMEEGMCCQ